MRKEAYAIRSIHFLISVYFLGCLLFLYYSILTFQESKLLYVAIISLLLEGNVIFLNDSNCPLGILHRRYGDNKTFFELFLPAKLAKLAIPILATTSIAGMVIFFIQDLVRT